MPRGPRVNAAGQPGQSGPGVPGQTYGHSAEQQALEAVMPTSDYTGGTNVPAVAPQGPATAVPVGPNPADRYASALASAEQLQGQMGLLTRPSSRPTEPVTTGMSGGPGAGPEALSRPPSRTAAMLQNLTLQTGNPKWEEMARKAGLL